MGAVDIRPARSLQDIDAARQLFRDYQAFLAVDLCFQGFEQELSGLPGAYAPPQGELLLAWHSPDEGGSPVVVGGVAVRPLFVKGAAVDGVCEMKRLYVYPSSQGQGVGRQLVEAILACARDLGYRRMVLDTLDRLSDAVALYRRFGFYDIPAYYGNSLAGVLFMESALSPVER